MLLSVLLVAALVTLANAAGKEDRSRRQAYDGAKSTAKKRRSTMENLKSMLSTDPIKLLKLDEQFHGHVRLVEEDFIKRGISPGDETKLEKLFQKGLRGDKVNLLVIGGSNAAGGVLGKDEDSLDGLFFKVFARWWQEVTGSVVDTYNVAISGLGSYISAFCFRNFIPKGVDIDIVMVEQAVNFHGEDKSAPLEALTRQLLALESSPVILFANFVSSLGKDPETKTISNPTCNNLENYGEAELAKRYGVASFSLKSVLCRSRGGQKYEVRKDVTKIRGVVASDGAHTGIIGHAQIALMIINHVRKLFLKHLQQSKDTPVNTATRLPNPVYNIQETETLQNPQCWLGPTYNACKKDAQHPSVVVKVEKKKGFKFYKKLVGENVICNGKHRTDQQQGWGGWGDEASITFRIQVDPWRSAAVINEHSRSVSVVLRGMVNGGKSLIWLDENRDQGITLDNKISTGNHIYTVVRRVTPGSHTLTVQTTSRGFFAVSGILIGPPDFNKKDVI